MAAIPMKTKKLIFLWTSYPGAERLKGSILVKNYLSHFARRRKQILVFTYTSAYHRSLKMFSTQSVMLVELIGSFIF